MRQLEKRMEEGFAQVNQLIDMTNKRIDEAGEETATTIKERLKRAVEALFTNQPNIFQFTSETGQTEWNLAHHLANEIHKDKAFSTLDCDLEVTKQQFGAETARHHLS